MVAAPQYATIIVQNRLGIRVPIDVYLSDVVDSLMTWDNGRGAGVGTPDFWVAPEPVTVVDFSIETGMTDTTKIQLTVNNMGIGAIPRYANQLNTLSYRSPMNLVVLKGQTLRAIQLAN